MNEFLALLLRTGLVLGLALGADAFLRRAAAVRSFLLRAALAAAVVAACAPWLFPSRIRPVVALPAPAAEAPELAPAETMRSPMPSVTKRPPSAPASNAASVAPLKSESVAVISSDPPSRVPRLPGNWPMALWGFGAAVTGVYWLVAHFAVVALRRRGRGVDGVGREILSQVCQDQGIAVPVLRQVPGLGSPLACGVLRPCILLPQEMAERGDRTELTAALAHEVAHLARRDVPWTYATRLVQSLLWFQPLVWGLHRRMVAASEELCDLQAVQNGLKRETYADCLLRLAEAASRPRIESALGSRMATKRSSLSVRIEALLDARRARVLRLSKRTRTLVGTGVAAIAIAGGVFVAVPAAARQQPPVASAQAIPGTEKEAKARFEELLAKYKKLKTVSITAVSTSNDRSTRLNVRFEKPNRFMAEVWSRDGVANPRRLIIVDGKKVTTYDEQEPEEAVRSTMASQDLTEVLNKQGRISLPLGLMLLIMPNAEAALSRWQTKETQFALAGKDRRSLILKIETQYGFHILTLGLDENGFVREENHRFGGGANPKGDVSTTLYSNARFDEPLPTNTFRFDPPRGVRTVAGYVPELHQEPAALNLLNRIDATGQGLNSVAFDVERTERITRKDAPESFNRIVRKIEYRKDGAARIEEDYPRHWGDVLVVSDGKELVARSEKSRKKVVRQTLASDPYSRMRQLLISAEYRVPQTAFGQLLEMSYFGWARAAGASYSSMKLGPKVKLDGEPMEVLVLESRSQKVNGAPAPGGTTERVFVDARGFIRRYEKVIAFGSTQRNEEIAVVRNLRINPVLPDSRFRLEVPAGYSVLKSGNVGLEETYRSYQPTYQLNPGEMAPATPFRTLDGRTTNLAAYKGKVVLVQGWTSGVTNYERDLPQAQRLHKRYAKDGLVVLAMGFYQGNQDVWMRRLIKEKGYTFTNVLDGPGNAGSLTRAWNIHSFPFSIVIGRDGMVRTLNEMDDRLELAVKLALSQK